MVWPGRTAAAGLAAAAMAAAPPPVPGGPASDALKEQLRLLCDFLKARGEAAGAAAVINEQRRSVRYATPPLRTERRRRALARANLRGPDLTALRRTRVRPAAASCPS